MTASDVPEAKRWLKPATAIEPRNHQDSATHAEHAGQEARGRIPGS